MYRELNNNKIPLPGEKNPDNKKSELTDHLGNVRVTFSENTETHAAVVESYADYYPHGGKMPGRNTNPGTYRYGYQGQYAEDETQETGFNSFDLRMYDAQLGRWISPDPRKQYASPYLGMGNNPVSISDPSGGEAWHPVTDENGNTSLVADFGDNEFTFIKYANEANTGLSSEEVVNYAVQIRAYANNNDNHIEGLRLTSSSGAFDNLMGKTISGFSINSSAFRTFYGPDKDCSPTSFNRAREAAKIVYQRDILGRPGNANYAMWNNYAGSASSSYGVGVLKSLNFGNEINGDNALNGTLKLGALLNLSGNGEGHSVYFMGYEYDDNNSINGFTFWETKGFGSSVNNSHNWQILKALNFY